MPGALGELCGDTVEDAGRDDQLAALEESA
jgi:hypothetical protein